MPKVIIKKVPKANNGLIIEGNKFTPLSSQTLNLNGKPHSEGGTMLSYGGNTVEAEKNEPISINNEGDLVIFGNLKNPLTGNKFKTDAKLIAKDENKADSIVNKASSLLDNNPYDRNTSLSFNTGMVLQSAADARLSKAEQDKARLEEMQSIMNGTATILGIKPESLGNYFSGGKVKRIAKDGDTVSNSDSSNPTDPNFERNLAIQSIRAAALRNGIDPDRFEKQLAIESGLNPKVNNSKAGAMSIAQFMPSTAKQYGLTEEDLKDTSPAGIAKVVDAAAKYKAQLKKQFNGDEVLAEAAYNGGIKNIKGNIQTLSKRTGKPVNEITGQDWYNFMSTRKDLPKGQVETVNYIKNLDKNTPDLASEEPTSTGQQFRNHYYDPNPRPVVSLTPDLSNPEDNIPNEYRINNVIPTLQPIPDQYSTAPYIDPSTINGTQKVQSYNTPAENNRKNLKGLRNKLSPLDFIGEAAAILDTPNYVQGQQYNPYLMTPYQVSLQDQINQNTASFNAIRQSASNNPEALSVLAGQKYGAEQQILGNQFRINQGNSNTVANQNNQILNQAALTNLQLNDTQAQRQEQARSNTQQARRQALNSIANKINENKRYNSQIGLYENLFNYRPDENYVMQYEGPAANLTGNNIVNQGLTQQQFSQLTPAQQQRYLKQLQDLQVQQQKLDNRRKESLDNSVGRTFKRGGKLRLKK